MSENSFPSSPIPPPPPKNFVLKQTPFPPPISHFKFFFLIPLLFLTFFISFFFFSQQRQPKTQTQASLPLSSPLPISSPAPTATTKSGKFPLSTPNLSPTDSFPPSTSPPNILPTRTISSPNRLSSSPDALRAIFEINAENDTFFPNQLTAYLDQIVSLSFFAKDKDYEIAIPLLSLKKMIKMGTKSSLEFQAIVLGEFVFECLNCENKETSRGLLLIQPK